jgi:hypothetical protein
MVLSFKMGSVVLVGATLPPTVGWENWKSEGDENLRHGSSRGRRAVTSVAQTNQKRAEHPVFINSICLL